MGRLLRLLRVIFTKYNPFKVFFDQMTTKKPIQLDSFDKTILRALQRDASLSQRELGEKVGLSQNACWRRVSLLRKAGVITGQTIQVDMQAVGLGLTVFVMMRTRQHSEDWLRNFRRSVLKIENVIDFFRIAGDYDYMLKVVAQDVNDFDRVYQKIIKETDLEAVTSYISMEAIADNRDLPT
jgi:Lrp/AsnC family transcriptional regulator